MRLKIPNVPLSVEIPRGWEGTPYKEVLHIHAPGAGDSVGRTEFVGTPVGEMSIFLVECTGSETLEEVCRLIWKRRTGVPGEYYDVVASPDGLFAFEWTDGVADIVSWLLRPRSDPELILEVQYSVDGRFEPRLPVPERDAIVRRVVSSLRHDGERVSEEAPC